MSKKRRSGAFAKTSAAALPDAAGLLETFRTMQRPLRLDDLLRVLHLPRRVKRDLETLLESLAAEGRLLRLRGGVWVAADAVHTVIGHYVVQRNGAGFVTPVEEKRGRGSGRLPDGDIFIHPTQAGDAWHGDLVRAALLPGRRGKNPEGRVLEVLERGRTEVAVHVVRREGAYFFCKPADPRLPFSVRVAADALPQQPGTGDLLLVRLEERLASDVWQGTARADFGREEDVAVQERLVKLNHQVPMEFPPRVLEEAAAFPADPRPEEMRDREDLRTVPFVTIDGESARDFDDAVHVASRPGGWLLRVAIADVTQYVRPGSALDREAVERGNSWYFPASVEPMLPEALSNGLCSLKPDADRLIMLAEVAFDGAGQPGHTRFAIGVIRSAARLSYTQVRRVVLDRDEAAREAMHERPRGAEVLSMLEEAERLARVLAQARRKRGSLDFDLPEPEYIFDEQGCILDIRRRERHFGHQIIEEFMIAANEAVARFLERKRMPFLYRVHPEPEPSRLDGLFRTLASTSLAHSLPARPGPGTLQAVLREAHGGPQEFLVGRLALRTMPQARYQPENEGHFGLASPCYCHFTSPIRRYADVIVHRALKHALGLARDPIPTERKLLIIADQLNRRERAAMDAEREMSRRLGTLVLRNRVGETFEGTISGVTDFGFFVELDAMPVEGMVRVADLGDDYFEYDQERQELIGVASAVRFRLGQRVSTRLAEVNVGRLEITLELTEPPSGDRRRGRYRPQAARRRGRGREFRPGARRKR